VWLASSWTATQDPKDLPRLDEVRVKVWPRCGWLGARDPTGSATGGTACRQARGVNPHWFWGCAQGGRWKAPKEWRPERGSSAARLVGDSTSRDSRGSSTPRDPSRQRKGSPWSETRHDGDGEQLGARCKAEGFGDEARVAGVGEVVCARVPESEPVHGLVRCSRASVERLLWTTGFRPRQAERSGSTHTHERVHRTRARRAKATAWSSACTSVRS
jgi:hypothetical protein